MVWFADQVLRQRRLLLFKVSVAMGDRLLPPGQLNVPLFPHVGANADGVPGTLKSKQRLLGHSEHHLTTSKHSLGVSEREENNHNVSLVGWPT